MADNFEVTAGSGTTIRAVEKGSPAKKHQVVVLDIGGAGAESLLTTTLPVSLASLPALAAGTNAIGKLAANSGVDIGDVDVTSIAPGESHLGAVGGDSDTLAAVTPTLTVHANYVSGDYVGESATPMSFAGCARVNAGKGRITGAVLIDYALQSIACELWLFAATITPPNDSAAWSISDADALKCIGVIPFNTYYASALNSVAPMPNLSIPFKCGAGSTTLFGCLVTRGAPAYASGDLSVVLSVAQD